MLTEEQKRMHRVCFTGHRPEKLKQTESVTVKALEAAIREAISDGKNVIFPAWLVGWISGRLRSCCVCGMRGRM